jgi:hypothetical protein
MSATDIIQPIVACIGNPVAGDPTQFVMERCASQLGLDWRFVTLQVEPDQFETGFLGIRALGFSGAMLLAPFCEQAANVCDEVTPTAKLLGRVDLATRRGDRWIGSETLARSLAELFRECRLESSSILCLTKLPVAEAWRSLDSAWKGIVLDSSQLDTSSGPESTTGRQPLPTESSTTGEEVLSRTFSAVVVDESCAGWSKRKMQTVPWADQGTLVLLDDSPELASWKEFAAQRQWRLIGSMDLRVQHYLESFATLTGQRANRLLIREALEEYLLW